MSNKLFSTSCERNQAPIFSCLKKLLPEQANILEVASGTGQHAVFFATQKPEWNWQLSDRPGFTESADAWREDSGLNNILPAIALDVAGPWPLQQYDAVFSANSLHIMSAQHVQLFFKQLQHVLNANGVAIFYGPFKRDGAYTSESNREFDSHLKQHSPDSAQRDVEWLQQLAKDNGLVFELALTMPANNEILVFKKLKTD